MAKTITVKFVDGEAVVTTSGFAGKACLAASAPIKAALGVTTGEKATREMAQPEQAQARQGARS